MNVLDKQLGQMPLWMVGVDEGYIFYEKLH